MPGSILNANILNANNQFIQSQNDIETAITAIETAILAGNQELNGAAGPVIEWHPYLKYLKYLQMIAENKLSGGAGGTVPGTFGGDNSVYLSDKCVASNWTYQTVYNFFNWCDQHNAEEIVNATASGGIGILSAGLAATIVGITAWEVAIMAIPAVVVGIILASQFNAGAVLDALEENKADIIKSLYNSVTLELSILPVFLPGAQISNISNDVTDIIDQSYTLSETVEKQLVGLIIDYCAVMYLFKERSHWPTKWQAGPPDNPVVCAQQTYTDEWIYGTPTLLPPFALDASVTAENIARAWLIEFTTSGRYVSFSPSELAENQTITATYRRAGDTSDRTRLITSADFGNEITFHSDGGNDCVELQLAATFEFSGYLWLRVPL